MIYDRLAGAVVGILTVGQASSVVWLCYTLRSCGRPGSFKKNIDEPSHLLPPTCTEFIFALSMQQFYGFTVWCACVNMPMARSVQAGSETLVGGEVLLQMLLVLASSGALF